MLQCIPGLVLGPVLFLLYVADAIELVKECGLIPHAFADDLQIYSHSVYGHSILTCPVRMSTRSQRSCPSIDLYAGVKIWTFFDVKGGGRIICGSTYKQSQVYMVHEFSKA